MIPFPFGRLGLGLVAIALLAMSGLSNSYPLDGYESTGITRLLHQRWIQEDELQGKKRPAGEL